MVLSTKTLRGLKQLTTGLTRMRSVSMICYSNAQANRATVVSISLGLPLFLVLLAWSQWSLTLQVSQASQCSRTLTLAAYKHPAIKWPLNPAQSLNKSLKTSHSLNTHPSSSSGWLSSSPYKPSFLFHWPPTLALLSLFFSLRFSQHPTSQLTKANNYLIKNADLKLNINEKDHQRPMADNISQIVSMP